LRDVMRRSGNDDAGEAGHGELQRRIHSRK
jgi:hypothetical protein